MRRIAIINQKGGVGKTTTTANLGAALAEQGRRVVLVDMDAQANLSLSLGVEAADGSPTSYSVLVGEAPFAAAVRPTAVPNLSLVASHIDLSGAEMELASQIGREFLLRDALTQWADDERARTGRAPADYVLFDCPPSLGLLSINALASAGEVLITLQTEFLALQGMSKLVGVVQLLRKRLNPELVVTGILPCLYESRLRLAREVLGEIRKYFPGQVLPVPIRANVKLAEAPSFGQTIFQYAPDSLGAMDYRCAAREVLRMESRDPDLAGLPPFRESVLAGTTYAERATDRAATRAPAPQPPAAVVRAAVATPVPSAPAAHASRRAASASAAPLAPAPEPAPAPARATAPQSASSAPARTPKRRSAEIVVAAPSAATVPSTAPVASAARAPSSATVPSAQPRTDVPRVDTPAREVTKPAAHEKRARRAAPVAARAITPPAEKPSAPTVTPARALTPADPLPTPTAPRTTAPRTEPATRPSADAKPARSPRSRSVTTTSAPVTNAPVTKTASTKPPAARRPAVNAPVADTAPNSAAPKRAEPAPLPHAITPATLAATEAPATPRPARGADAHAAATKPPKPTKRRAARDTAVVLTPVPPPASRRDASAPPPATPPAGARGAAPAREDERIVRADDLPPLPPDAFEILASFGLDP